MFESLYCIYKVYILKRYSPKKLAPKHSKPIKNKTFSNVFLALTNQGKNTRKHSHPKDINVKSSALSDDSIRKNCSVPFTTDKYGITTINTVVVNAVITFVSREGYKLSELNAQNSGFNKLSNNKSLKA